MTSKPLPAGGMSVMSQRREPPDSLDFFPTPPWATRALAEIVLPQIGLTLDGAVVWDPCAGEGHMAEVLAEYAGLVVHSDVHDYGIGSVIGSFVGQGPDVIGAGARCESVAADWLIFNPPFNLAVEFFERAIREADQVALLVRSNWTETADRYERVFSKHPPIAVAQFAERVPMSKGRWDPDGSTATAYAWIVWVRGACVGTQMLWIPPGQRIALTRPADVARFAASKAVRLNDH